MSKEYVYCETQEIWDYVANILNRTDITCYKDNGDSININSPNQSEFRNNMNLDNYTIYTFQEWCDKFNHKSDFSKKELTELPEKWCVQRTKEHGYIINKWFCDNNYGKPYLCDDSYIRISNSSYTSNCIDYTKITFEQFKKWVLEKDIVEDKPVKANRFKKGDKVCIPRIKNGQPWYKNNKKELDDYNENYFVIAYDYNYSTNVGLYRADGKIFSENSFYESDLVPYIESVKEEWIPKVGDWIYADANITSYPTQVVKVISVNRCSKAPELGFYCTANFIKSNGSFVSLNTHWSSQLGDKYTLIKAEAHEIPSSTFVPRGNRGVLNTWEEFPSMKKEILLGLLNERYIPGAYPYEFITYPPTPKECFKSNKLPTKSWY